jgi:putative transposase
MKRKRYTEEKITSILEEHEAGASVPDLSRRYGVAENTIYSWKSKFGGMEVCEAKRLRELEAENRELEQPSVEAEFD